MPEYLSSVPDYTFSGCVSLEQVNIPNNAIEIDWKAFAGCESLKNIEFPDRLCCIESLSFQGCESISQLFLPHDITIAKNAFSGCTGIRIVKWNTGKDSLIHSNRKNEVLLYTLFSDLESIDSLILNGETINANDVFHRYETEFKVMSMLYNGIGMNLTKIKGNSSEENSFKAPYKGWGHSLNEFFFNPQCKSFILSENWYRFSGIGLVLGWNGYRAIDVDGLGGYNLDPTIEDFLKNLGLPQDYPWVVYSGSKYGFHIVFKTEILEHEFASTAYTPNLHYVYDRLRSARLFERLELRWQDHLVLPPSIHSSGNKYEFWKDIPNNEPTTLSLASIDNLLFHYCGRVEIKSYTYSEKKFKLAENNKCYAEYDSWHYKPEIETDSIEWLEKSDSPDAQNSLAIKYLVGDGVTSNKAKARELLVKSCSDIANFNIASLIACGYFYGTKKDVEYYLNQIQDPRILSYVEYDDYDDNLVEQLFEEIRRNAEDLEEEELNLFFDTETTGLPKSYDLPSSDVSNWPRIVQLSWIITTKDGKLISENDYIIKPTNFEIPVSSSAIHGITTKLAKDKGHELPKVLDKFMNDVGKVKCLIGHNVNFDKKVVEAELIRLGRDSNLFHKPCYCTMTNTVNFCMIPDRNGYKYPKLQELYKKLFMRNFEDVHNSAADVKATMECYFELKRRGKLYNLNR